MVLAGEFLGIDTDKGIFTFFRRYHARGSSRPWPVSTARLSRARRRTCGGRRNCSTAAWPPACRCSTRWRGEALWLIASFPLHVCQFARAKGSKLFKGTAAFGYDHLARNTFFGFRVHLRCSDLGPVPQIELTPADVSDSRPPPRRWRRPGGGVGIGDRNYWSPDRQAELARQGFTLLAPYRLKAKDPHPEHSKLLTRFRRTIETVIGQLAERFNAKRTWARDLWHLCDRLTRKVLSHTTAMLLNLRAGNPPLQLDLLIDT